MQQVLHTLSSIASAALFRCTTPCPPPLPPFPLQDWEREDMVNIDITVYGGRSKRVVVRMHLPMERDRKALLAATRGLIRDVKHSRWWRCSFCGTDCCRETQVQIYIMDYVEPPRVFMWMHHICDHDNDECFDELELAYNVIREFCWKVDPEPLPRPHKPDDGLVYPLAAACAGCQEDTSLLHEMKRCKQCHLTRYCSVECQRKDWPRHKPTCKQIHSVLYDDDAKDPRELAAEPEDDTELRKRLKDAVKRHGRD